MAPPPAWFFLNTEASGDVRSRTLRRQCVQKRGWTSAPRQSPFWWPGGYKLGPKGVAMLMDRWYRVAIPILEYIHRNGDPDETLSVGQITAVTGIGADDVSTELESLFDAGYLVGEVRKY